MSVSLHAVDDEKEEKIVSKDDEMGFEPISLLQNSDQCYGSSDEKVLVGQGNDRRKPFGHSWDSRFIVCLLRAYDKDNKCLGTATGSICGTCNKNNMIYIITCAHAVSIKDEPDNPNDVIKVNKIEAELRQSENNQVIYRFEADADNIHIYNDYYQNPTNASGNDLAMIVINAKTNLSKMMQKVETVEINGQNITASTRCTLGWGIGDLFESECPLSKDEIGTYGNFKKQVKIQSKATIIGFPGQKAKGGIWGMEGNIESSDKNDALWIYKDIDTSPGQSGSPIVAHTYLVGIHTGGNQAKKKNWGTKLLPRHLDWMREIMKVDKNQSEIPVAVGLALDKDDKNVIATMPAVFQSYVLKKVDKK